jgi:peptide/nickel transport system substrate-binding protein
MEKAGFKVDMQSSDWQSVVARRVKKDPANAGGWHAMLTSWVAADVLNPVMTGFVNSTCDKAMFGWPCDAEIEKLRDQFARETDPAKQKEIAVAVQLRELKVVTHIQLGQYNVPTGIRKTISGILPAPAPVFWNVEKKG